VVPIEWTFAKCAFQEGYLSHVRSVHEKVKLLCDICGDSFNQRVALKKHKTQKHEDEISEQHKDEGSPFPCNICEKILFTSELLKDHLQFIHNLTKEEIKNNCTKDEERLNKPLVCELCNGTFNYRASLKQHIKVVHDGHKDFVCDQCGSSSSTAANLKKHIESIHRGSTKCSCTICGKVFRDSNVMKFHVRSVHEKKKDYICEECGFPFYLRLALKAHLAKVHSIGTTYDCQECGKKFGKKTTLSLHTDTVHNGVKHQCDQCVKSFTQRANHRWSRLNGLLLNVLLMQVLSKMENRILHIYNLSFFHELT
jgi:KRAB domain-containing zinc finger protein